MVNVLVVDSAAHAYAEALLRVSDDGVQLVVTDTKLEISLRGVIKDNSITGCNRCNADEAFAVARSVALASVRQKIDDHMILFSSVCHGVESSAFVGDCTPRVIELDNVRRNCSSLLSTPVLCNLDSEDLSQCMQSARPSIRFYVAPAVRVLPPPRGFNCQTLSIYRGVGSIPIRMLLELYFGQPILVRSFFHGNRSDPFMWHQYDPPKSANGVVIYSDPVLQAYALCGGKADQDTTLECIHAETELYAKYTVAALLGPKTSVACRFEEWQTDEFLNKIHAAIPPNCLSSKTDFNPALAQAARTYLSDEAILQRKNSIQAGATRRTTGDPEDEAVSRVLQEAAHPARVEFGLLYNSTIFSIFLDEWRGRQAELTRWFPQMDPKIAYRRMLVSTQESIQIVDSGPNDVHVLLPTKSPPDLSGCIESLVSNLDAEFGRVHFHFGVNWADTSTITAIKATFATRKTIQYRIHEVFNRASDISTIVNHLFAMNTNGRYFLRFNDDSRMATKGWNRIAITALRHDPVDVGLALMRDPNHPRGLQTHSFVSHMHRQFFGGLYFPVHFRNWHEDDWITEAYPAEWRRPTTIELKHATQNERYERAALAPVILRRIMRETKSMVQSAAVRLNITAPSKF